MPNTAKIGHIKNVTTFSPPALKKQTAHLKCRYPMVYHVEGCNDGSEMTYPLRYARSIKALPFYGRSIRIKTATNRILLSQFK